MQTETDFLKGILDALQAIRSDSELEKAVRFVDSLVAPDEEDEYNRAANCASFQMGVEYAFRHPEHAQAWIRLVRMEGDPDSEGYDEAVRRYPLSSHD